jgi:hypothetical protein
MTGIDDGTWRRIREVLDRYPHVVDSAVWADLGRCFAPDAMCDMREVGLGRTDGLDALVDAFAAMTHPVAHHLLNPVVEDVAGGRVTVRSKFLVVLADRSTFGGDYLDVFVEVPDIGWRIVERRVTPRQAGSRRPLHLQPSD